MGGDRKKQRRRRQHQPLVFDADRLKWWEIVGPILFAGLGLYIVILSDPRPPVHSERTLRFVRSHHTEHTEMNVTRVDGLIFFEGSFHSRMELCDQTFFDPISGKHRTTTTERQWQLTGEAPRLPATWCPVHPRKYTNGNCSFLVEVNGEMHLEGGCRTMAVSGVFYIAGREHSTVKY